MPPSLKLFLFCWSTGLGLHFVRYRNPRILKLIAVSIICIVGMGCVGAALLLAKGLTPKYDLWLLRADSPLGAPAFWVSQKILGTWLYPVLVAIYEALPAVLLLVYAAHSLLQGGDPNRVIVGYWLSFCVGFCLYFLMPACGPVYVFPAFPAVPASQDLKTLSVVCSPNCMPSLHASTAILAVMFLWRWKWLRVPAVLNLTLTLLATLATGEHYLIDLVVAVPFAWFIYAAVHRRLGIAASWLAVVLVCIVGVRLGFTWILPGSCMLIGFTWWLFSDAYETSTATFRPTVRT